MIKELAVVLKTDRTGPELNLENNAKLEKNDFLNKVQVSEYRSELRVNH